MAGTLYKVLNGDGTPFHGGSGRWPLPHDGQPGEWLEVKGKLVPCKNGLHLCTLRQLRKWFGPALFEAEYRGERRDDSDKVVVRRARLLRRVETWNERTLRLWACDCAERAVSRIARPDPRSVEAISVARAYARGDASEEQLNAAWDAARAAAWDAVRDAAGASAWAVVRAAAAAAAWNAAGASAWAAAWAAAGAAAWNAAGASAWAAAEEEEIAWQMARLKDYLDGRVN